MVDDTHKSLRRRIPKRQQFRNSTCVFYPKDNTELQNNKGKLGALARHKSNLIKIHVGGNALRAQEYLLEAAEMYDKARREKEASECRHLSSKLKADRLYDIVVEAIDDEDYEYALSNLDEARDIYDKIAPYYPEECKEKVECLGVF